MTSEQNEWISNRSTKSELEYFDFDCEYQQQLEQEQVELMNKYGLQKFNELFEVTAWMDLLRQSEKKQNFA